MPLPRLQRPARRTLLIEFNPYQILAAEISRPRRGPVVLESAAEFTREDTDGLRRWIEAGDRGRKSRVTAICGLVPHRGIIQRESVLPDRLAEPGYLAEVFEEQQKGRFLSATPFKIFHAKTWTLRALSAVDGTALPHSGPPRPALICAMARNEALEVQQRLVESHVTRDRIEPGLLSLFGALYGNMEQRGGSRAIVVVVIHRNVTAIFILGKEGVHTPNPVLHGLDSIIEIGRKELGEIDEDEVQTQLHIGAPEIIKHGAKLVRRIGRDLKPVVDSFEMTTGQPVDEIYCASLPPTLQWLADPLAQATGRTPLAFDCASWLPTAGLQLAEGGPTFGPHWLGALSLVAHLPETSSLNTQARAGDATYHRPWHIDCSVPLETDQRKLAGRPFVTGAVACAVAAFALVVTAWQLYATYSLRADTQYWAKQMTGNRRLFEELNTATAALKTQTAVLDRAYEMMGESFLHSNLFINLGRTVPPRMRVERIETNDERVAISGSLLEPAEEASGTLGRHMDDIRRHPDLGPLFSHIAITSLQRQVNSDFVVFELTLRLKRPTR